MKRLLLPAAVGLAAVIAVAGCRRLDDEDDPVATGTFVSAGIPDWSLSAASVLEGRSLTLTLSISRPAGPGGADVSVDSSDASIASAPTIVTFPEGATTRLVVITSTADDSDLPRVATVTAATNAGSSTVEITVVEDDVTVGNASGPVTYGTGIALLPAAGVDTVFGSPDDEVLVASGIGAATPVVTHLVVGAMSNGTAGLPVPTGITDTALLVSSSSVLDRVVQLNAVSSAPAVGPVLNLACKGLAASRPVMVGTTAAVVTLGPDGLTSGDDFVTLVRGLGSASLTSSIVPLPGLAPGAPSIPVPVDATSFLIVTTGPDFAFATGDEVLSLVAEIDTTATVTPLLTGRIDGNAQGQPLYAGSGIAAVLSAGADAAFHTGDDVLLLVRDISGAPALAPPYVAGPLTTDAAHPALSTGAGQIVFPSMGTDLLPNTSDDDVVVFTDLAADPITATTVSVPFATPGAQGRLLLSGATTAIRLHSGPDALPGTSDDSLAAIIALAMAPTSTVTTVGAVASAPPVVSGSEAYLVGEGSDQTPGTADDVAIRVTPGSSFSSSAGIGPFAFLSPPALVPTSGTPAFAARTAGLDLAPGTADDRLSVGSAP